MEGVSIRDVAVEEVLNLPREQRLEIALAILRAEVEQRKAEVEREIEELEAKRAEVSEKLDKVRSKKAEIFEVYAKYQRIYNALGEAEKRFADEVKAIDEKLRIAKGAYNRYVDKLEKMLKD